MLAQALSILEQTYGYTAFRDPQQAVIEAALNGHDSLVLMPTGGGKSLCYQIPAIVRPGVGIVVSPLIALMQDQVSALQQLGINAAFINSTLTHEQYRHVSEQLNSGQLQLLYIAPERLMQPNTLEWLARLPISLIAIDEAHCVSQWGHDFRQDYLLLHQLTHYFPNVPRMALTATANPLTQTEIIERLALTHPKQFSKSFDRANIYYSVAPKTDTKKQLIKFLAGHKHNSGIVYCMSRKKVESTAAWLCSRGLTALPYHAGLSSDIRAVNQERFLREDAVIIVATIAFGMGIDKPDVRFVCHLDLPKSIEAYYQETGRAGRDGEPAEAWMIYGLQDVVRLSQMAEDSSASEQHKRNEKQKLDTLLAWCETTQCRRKLLLAYFDEHQQNDCGHCDTCTHPPKTWDATIEAQKLLSCIYRTEQRFGLGYVLDVLRGRAIEKIQHNRHHQLSTFGIGTDRSEKQWRSIARQLIVRGFIYADHEHYGVIKLTDNARPLLRSEIALHLREDIDDEPLRQPKRQQHGVSDADRALWEALRQCRKQLAEEHGVPPYVIFHDATLMEMMEDKPTSEQQMLHISGVGETKMERFGWQFLEVIAPYAD